MIDFSLMAILWLVIIVALIIIEGLTVNLVTVWFAIAAIPAFILSLFEVNITIQIAVFGIVAIVLLLTTKPFVTKMQKGKTIKTNYETLIGDKAVALQDFGEMENGYVKVNGMEWLAHSEKEIKTGDVVIIKSVSGAKLKVEKF